MFLFVCASVWLESAVAPGVCHPLVCMLSKLFKSCSSSKVLMCQRRGRNKTITWLSNTHPYTTPASLVSSCCCCCCCFTHPQKHKRCRFHFKIPHIQHVLSKVSSVLEGEGMNVQAPASLLKELKDLMLQNNDRINESCSLRSKVGHFCEDKFVLVTTKRIAGTCDTRDGATTHLRVPRVGWHQLVILKQMPNFDSWNTNDCAAHQTELCFEGHGGQVCSACWTPPHVQHLLMFGRQKAKRVIFLWIECMSDDKPCSELCGGIWAYPVSGVGLGGGPGDYL